MLQHQGIVTVLMTTTNNEDDSPIIKNHSDSEANELSLSHAKTHLQLCICTCLRDVPLSDVQHGFPIKY